MTITLTNPTRTFKSGTMELKLGKRKVDARYAFPVTPAATSSLSFPTLTLYSPAIWAGQRLCLIWLTPRSTIGFPRSTRMLEAIPERQICAGSRQCRRGCGHQRLSRLSRRFAIARVKEGIAKGLTVDQAKQQLTLPEKYKAFAFPNFAVPNVEDMFKELNGTKGK